MVGVYVFFPSGVTAKKKGKDKEDKERDRHLSRKKGSDKRNRRKSGTPTPRYLDFKTTTHDASEPSTVVFDVYVTPSSTAVETNVPEPTGGPVGPRNDPKAAPGRKF